MQKQTNTNKQNTFCLAVKRVCGSRMLFCLSFCAFFCFLTTLLPKKHGFGVSLSVFHVVQWCLQESWPFSCPAHSVTGGHDSLFSLVSYLPLIETCTLFTLFFCNLCRYCILVTVHTDSDKASPSLPWAAVSASVEKSHIAVTDSWSEDSGACYLLLSEETLRDSKDIYNITKDFYFK